MDDGHFQALVSADLFEGLHVDELSLIAKYLQTVSLAAGSRLFDEGDAGDAVYVICSGRLQLEVDGMRLLERTRGQCIGEFALIDDKPRSATAAAITDVILLRWERGDFQKMLTSHPSVARCVFRLLTTKLRENVRAEVSLRLEQARWQQDLARAREIQMGMLPPATYINRHLELAGFCEPAYEVGGDFYDYIELEDGRIGLVICDVTGHGFYAGLFVAMAKSALRTQATQVSLPDHMMQVIRRTLDLSLYKLLMSCCCILIDPIQNRLIYANAGHPPGFLLRTNSGSIHMLQPLDPILGALPVEESVYETASLPWLPGDVLALYTDGITEARNDNGEMLGENFVETHLRHTQSSSAEQIRDNMLNDFKRRRGSHICADDVTLLIARARVQP